LILPRGGVATRRECEQCGRLVTILWLDRYLESGCRLAVPDLPLSAEERRRRVAAGGRKGARTLHERLTPQGMSAIAHKASRAAAEKRCRARAVAASCY
jgi:hypothetical protein